MRMMLLCGPRTETFSLRPKKLQGEVCRIQQWAQKWSFSISGPKYKFIIFSRKRKVKDLSIKIDGNSIKTSPDVSFLGVTFNQGLTWSPHTKTVGARCAKGLHLRRSLVGTSWKARQGSLLLQNKTLIRSQLDDGSQAFWDMCKTNRKKLETIQAKAYGCVWVLSKASQSVPCSRRLASSSRCRLMAFSQEYQASIISRFTLNDAATRIAA